ncbi:BLOC-2 complex member HPS6 [Hemitrygon akajei]|uniref:BLOC-2 complex member HPS6 n=1 Tax=Hemitrygon akajei TaxID=2704970 RepID=UPI003BF94C3E
MPLSLPRRPSGFGPWRELFPGARFRLGASGRLFVYLPRERRVLGLEPSPTCRPGPLDRRLPPTEHLLEVLELDEKPSGDPRTPGPLPTVLVTETGRAELWVPGAAGWKLQRDFQLCHSPRAKVLAAAWDGLAVTWCEERPRSEAQQYYVCSRNLGHGLALGAARIVLHNSPACQLFAAGDAVYLLPGKTPGNGLSNGPLPGNFPNSGPGNLSVAGYCPSGNNPVPSNGPIPGNFPSNSPVNSGSDEPMADKGPPRNLDKFMVIWRPQEDTWTFTSLAHGPLFTKRLLASDADFRKLAAGAVGLLAGLPTLDLRAVSVSPAGLLAAAASGEINLVRSDGTVRHLGQLRPGVAAEASGRRMLMELSSTTLACALGRTVWLLDVATGRAMGETELEYPPLALLSCRDTGELQALTEDGLYSLGGGCEPWPGDAGYLETLVLEEACDYYQKRSLSRIRLTVERLKSEATFRAPAALCWVLQSRLSPARGSGPRTESQAQLRRALTGEVESYAGLEQTKRRLVRATEAETSACVEELAGQEVSRLLLSSPPEPGALLHLRLLSLAFPAETWRALSRALRLPAAQAGAEQWKALLTPAASPELPAAFELTCSLMQCFQPDWLPGFVELAQRQLPDGRPYRGPPLYKRALSVLPPAEADTAVELLLRSQRPNAVLQAVRLLLERGRCRRAVESARRFSGLGGPLLRKELFAALLAELGRRRELDPFLPELCELCPPSADAAPAPELLRTLLDALPPAAGPYADGHAGTLTLGPLRPLLRRLLERGPEPGLEAEEPVFPPPTPPREKKAVEEIC